MKKFISVALSVCFIFLLSSCAFGNPFVGKWQSEQSESNVIVFHENGTVNTSGGNSSYRYTVSGKYAAVEVQNNVIMNFIMTSNGVIKTENGEVFKKIG